jgi:hypothetical protein
MKNTNELNDIYYAIAKLKQMADYLKRDNDWEQYRECQRTAESAEKAYEKIRQIIG